MIPQVVRNWYQRYFSDPQAALLAVLLLAGFTTVLTMDSVPHTSEQCRQLRLECREVTRVDQRWP